METIISQFMQCACCFRSSKCRIYIQCTCSRSLYLVLSLLVLLEPMCHLCPNHSHRQLHSVFVPCCQWLKRIQPICCTLYVFALTHSHSLTLSLSFSFYKPRLCLSSKTRNGAHNRNQISIKYVCRCCTRYKLA